MCTVTWAFSSEGYDVFFNRDEKRTRVEAHPPSAQRIDDVRCLFCVDSEGGGTWLGVNEYGLTVGVLNYYQREPFQAAGTHFYSRGFLVKELLPCAAGAACDDRLAHQPLSKFRPFILFWIFRDHVFVRSWDGRTLRVWASVPMPLCSSSVDTHAVLQNRREVFGQFEAEYGAASADWLPLYHQSHLPGRGHKSVCMHRPDAKTVSYSHIRVRTGRVVYAYMPDAPCSGKNSIVCSCNGSR